MGDPKDIKMHNRLIHQQSPYLLQHARNPVDWYPWGPEAFDRAAREDKPVFLSIGYSTCHWCHVMAHESFQDEHIAELLNQHFIAIKVDREERPDVDDVYMRATQLMTGRGGWPNSVWLLADRRPFYAGTYFPPEDHLGQIGFATLLRRLIELWQTRRADVEKQAEQFASVIRQSSASPASQSDATISRELIDSAVEDITSHADLRYGGFGGPPKFPPHSTLALLLHEHARAPKNPLPPAVSITLDAMDAGGIRDHLGGGFHRYSTDARWFLPHFEKMLYDNAQLAVAYTMAYQTGGQVRYAQAARQTLEFCLSDLRDAGGAFHSAFDADSEGVEGRFYLWTRQGILDALGDAEGELFCRAYGVEPGGNYRLEHTGQTTGMNILYLPRPLEQTAKVEGIELGDLSSRLATGRARLLELRRRRIWPAKDDKVLTSWNALLIGALAQAGKILQEPRYVQAATEAARFLLTHLCRDGLLLALWRNGPADVEGFLDDYAFMADALLDLNEATGDELWLNEAAVLAGQMTERFAAPAGGFYFTSASHEQLLLRPLDPYDRALPSGNGVAGRALVRLAKATGQGRWLDHADHVFRSFLPQMSMSPHGTESLLLAASIYLDAVASGLLRPANLAMEQAAVYPVTVTASAEPDCIPPGGQTTVKVRISIQDGWHINSAQTGTELLPPTRTELAQAPLATAGKPEFPPAQTMLPGPSQEPLNVYQNEVIVTLPVTLSQEATGEVTLHLRMRAQACNDRLCLGEKTFELHVPVTICGRASSESR